MATELERVREALGAGSSVDLVEFALFIRARVDTVVQQNRILRQAIDDIRKLVPTDLSIPVVLKQTEIIDAAVKEASKYRAVPPKISPKEKGKPPTQELVGAGGISSGEAFGKM